MTVESSLPIGKPTDKVLDTTQVTQTDGTVAEREAVSVHTLETDGTDTTSFSGYGINRIAVASSGTANKNTSTITGDAYD